MDDPKDYRWCSYAEAVAGKTRSREGLQRVKCCHVDRSFKVCKPETSANPDFPENPKSNFRNP